MMAIIEFVIKPLTGYIPCHSGNQVRMLRPDQQKDCQPDLRSMSSLSNSGQDDPLSDVKILNYGSSFSCAATPLYAISG